MNPWAILAALALYGGTFTYAVWERADAIKARADISTLEASYTTKAAAAEIHAQAVEASDLKARDAESVAAIQQATYAANQAQLAAATYKQKLAQLAGKPNLDLGHQCANVRIPDELVPNGR